MWLTLCGHGDMVNPDFFLPLDLVATLIMLVMKKRTTQQGERQ
jgi:hypothetical protein